MTVGTHIGANTHNQDQLIYPVSFNTINTIANNPQNPIPPLELLFELLLTPSTSQKLLLITTLICT